MSLNKTQQLALLIGLIVALILFFKPTNVEVSSSQLAPNATILAFGDSLTFGYGAVNAAYPLALAKLSGKKVINAGISGEVSTNGLGRLPALLEQYHPALLILCHGGNDILRRRSQDQLKANLGKMVTMAQESGAQVLVVGVPGFGLFGASTLALYGEVATEMGVLYEGAILEKIENDTTLKSDQIHPNALGYRLMAEAFFEVLIANGVLN